MILGGPASGTTRALLAGVSDSDGGGRVRGDDRPLHLDADTGDTVSAHNRIVREGASVDGTGNASAAGGSNPVIYLCSHRIYW